VDTSRSKGQAQMNQKQPQQEQKRILAVDDEPDLTMICSLALQYHGFKVDTSNDPQEALSNLSQIIMIWLFLTLRCLIWMVSNYMIR
jgi:PleD family two-component response regulator